MATKAKSKSVEKREAVQKQAGRVVDRPEGNIDLDVMDKNVTKLLGEIVLLNEKVQKLEAGQASLSKAFRWGANEIRPLFSMSPIALIFDGIAEKLRK